MVMGKYSVTYPKKGGIISAPEGTVGLMCFDSVRAARRWRNFVLTSIEKYLLIRVEPLANVKRRESITICEFVGVFDLILFYASKSSCGSMPPLGSVACDKLKIGDDYGII